MQKHENIFFHVPTSFKYLILKISFSASYPFSGSKTLKNARSFVFMLQDPLFATFFFFAYCSNWVISIVLSHLLISVIITLKFSCSTIYDIFYFPSKNFYLCINLGAFLLYLFCISITPPNIS